MLKPFQKQDLARAACHDGLVLAWDTGLGKTWAAFLWPLLKLGYDWAPPISELRSPISAGEQRRPRTPALAPSPNSDLPSAISSLPRPVPRGSILIVAPGDLHQQMRDEAERRFRLNVTVIDDQQSFLNRVLRVGPGGRPEVAPGFYLTSYQALAINGTRSMPDPDDAGGRTLMDQFSPSLADLCWNTFDCVVVDEGQSATPCWRASASVFRSMAWRSTSACRES